MITIRTLISGIAFGAAAVSFGQMPGEMPDLEHLPVIFLNQKVVADMQLSPAVRQKEMSIMMQGGMSMMGMAKGGQSSPGVKNKIMAAMRKWETDSLAPLTGPQRARYRQLTLQFEGPAAMQMPNVAAQLNLSSGQRAKLSQEIGASERAMANQMKNLQGSASSNPMGAMQQMRTAQQTIRAAQDKAAKSILTAAQWAKWNDMQGKKIPGITDLFGGRMGGG
jgi:hypothetical protein